MTRPSTQVLADLLHETSKRRSLRDEESAVFAKLVDQGVKPRVKEFA